MGVGDQLRAWECRRPRSVAADLEGEVRKAGCRVECAKSPYFNKNSHDTAVCLTSREGGVDGTGRLSLSWGWGRAEASGKMIFTVLCSNQEKSWGTRVTSLIFEKEF